jgi:hypothetical protein
VADALTLKLQEGAFYNNIVAAIASPTHAGKQNVGLQERMPAMTGDPSENAALVSHQEIDAMLAVGFPN